MSSKKHILASIILLSSCLISCGKKETLPPVSDGIILSEENAKEAAEALATASEQLFDANTDEAQITEEALNEDQSENDTEVEYVSDFTFGAKLIQGTTKPQQAGRTYSSWDFDITSAMEPIPDDYVDPDYLLYVSNSNKISADTYVGEMVPISQNFSTEKQIYTEDVVILERRAAQAAISMLNDVNTLYPDTTIVPDSGYRSVADQQAVMDKYIRPKSGSHCIKYTLSSLDTPFAPPLF